MKNSITQTRTNVFKCSRGAAAIEFVFLFIIFFAFFYAIATYSLIFMLQTSFHHAANEGARSAISVDPQAFVSETAYIDSGVIPVVRTTVGNALSWLPVKARNQVLGMSNGNVDVTVVNKVLTVRVIYQNYVSNPLIPLINLPGIGPIFSTPTDLQGRAVLKLT